MNRKYEIPEENNHVVSEPVAGYVSKSTPIFTGYQMQILESIANVHDDDEMRDIRNLIADYFSNKALDAMDKLCEEGKLSTQIIESWQSEHMRTPYNY